MTTSFTPIYPTSLPDVWSYQGTPVDQVLRTSTTSAGNGATEPTSPIQYRNRTRVPAASVQVGWSFLEEEYKIFVAWWRDTLLIGHKWFWTKLPSAGGITWMICRFSDTNFTTTQAGHRYYQVTANIDIRERAFSPQAAPFGFFEDFESGLSQYIEDTGNVAVYTIVPGMTVNCLQCTTQSSGQIARITRILPQAYSCTNFSVDFVITNQQSDDTALVELLSGTTTAVFAFNPSRESVHKPQVSVPNGAGGFDQYFVQDTTLTQGVIYTFEISIVSGAGNTIARIKDKLSGSVVSSLALTGSYSPPVFDRLSFLTDSGGQTSDTTYDNIFIT